MRGQTSHQQQSTLRLCGSTSVRTIKRRLKLSRLEEFIIAFPGACNAPNPKGWGKWGHDAFKDELARKDSEHAKADGVSLHDRLLPAIAFTIAEGVDHEAAAFGLDLLKLCSLAHDGKNEEADELQAELEPVEANFPTINKLYTVQEARAGQWA